MDEICQWTLYISYKTIKLYYSCSNHLQLFYVHVYIYKHPFNFYWNSIIKGYVESDAIYVDICTCTYPFYSYWTTIMVGYALMHFICSKHSFLNEVVYNYTQIFVLAVVQLTPSS